jgi:hypothetical protein
MGLGHSSMVGARGKIDRAAYLVTVLSLLSLLLGKASKAVIIRGKGIYTDCSSTSKDGEQYSTSMSN